MSQNTVLVTGATAGIGLVTARALIEQGNKVVVTGRSQDKLASVRHELGSDVVTVLCDNENRAQVDVLGSELRKQGITLSGVVLNAGVFFPNTLSETSHEEFDKTIDTNFRAPLFTIRSLLPVLENPASIVLISSLVVRKAFPQSSLYTASKTALEGLMGVLNKDLADRGIRLNSVRPGVTATEIQAKAGMDSESYAQLEQSMAALPLGRMLTPQDMLPAILMLLSDKTEGIRGAGIDVDAGFN